MKISEEEVRHVAKLSKLSFTDQETREFAQSLTKIVDMVELLNEVDTEGVPVTTTMADRKNVMREDVAQAGQPRKELFKNVPEEKDYYIKVPAIFEEGGDA
ncbi:Asp-tRNA(Asn)/Glu-tRNA(Gln) amidotransferase subunit GatC [Streptococcus suis]|nr:Asp-tRNA(Asn)/Glu-tRNA(Gln) amidotransferase subunit GatC [Streptococcus suis]